MKPNTLRVAVLASDRGSAEDASSGFNFVKHLLQKYSMLCMLGHGGQILLVKLQQIASQGHIRYTNCAAHDLGCCKFAIHGT